MVFICALGAAIANALTSVFQRMGVEDAPAESTLTLGLLTHALRRGIWLLGFVLMVFSFLFQAIALIALAHIGFDRALGYGLKYSAGFGATHLGRS